MFIDSITWTWSSPVFFTNVVQTFNDTTTTRIEGGFLSGEPTKSGTYTLIFNTTGRFYYCCEAHPDSIGLRGFVDVRERTQTSTTSSPSTIKIDDTTSTEKSSNPNYSLIFGIVGAIGGAVIVIGAILFVLKRRRKVKNSVVMLRSK